MTLHGKDQRTSEINAYKFFSPSPYLSLFSHLSHISPISLTRPLLLLKNEHGFVGLKSAGKTEVVCSKSNYEVIFVEASNDGHYYLKGKTIMTDRHYCLMMDTPGPKLLGLKTGLRR